MGGYNQRPCNIITLICGLYFYGYNTPDTMVEIGP